SKAHISQCNRHVRFTPRKGTTAPRLIGTDVHLGVARLLLFFNGTVIWGLVQSSRVLVLKRFRRFEEEQMYKHILIPTDGSELSQKAIDHQKDIFHNDFNGIWRRGQSLLFLGRVPQNVWCTT